MAKGPTFPGTGRLIALCRSCVRFTLAYGCPWVRRMVNLLHLGASGGVHLHRVPLTLADNMYGDQRNSLCVCYYLTPLFYFFKENKRVCQWRPPHVS